MRTELILRKGFRRGDRLLLGFSGERSQLPQQGWQATCASGACDDSFFAASHMTSVCGFPRSMGKTFGFETIVD